VLQVSVHILCVTHRHTLYWPSCLFAANTKPLFAMLITLVHRVQISFLFISLNIRHIVITLNLKSVEHGGGRSKDEAH
jgi:hypothetical protein